MFDENDVKNDLKIITRVPLNMVDIPLSYNGILERPLLHDLGVVTNTQYMVKKVPIIKGNVTI